jgi:hypothetical protein
MIEDIEGIDPKMMQEIMEQLILVEVDRGIILVVEDLVLWLYDINLNNYGTFCKNRGR